MSRVVVAGGGIAGLSVAWALKSRDPLMDVLLLERAARPGGNIRTERIGGYVCEAGPDGFLDNAPATLALVRALGLDDRLQPSSDAARHRFIFRAGRLHEVPTSPFAMARSGLLSARGKLRLACEPFAPRRRDDDESIHGFARRRIGSEAAQVLVDSMVSGVFAGDASMLSLSACFPRMRQLEDEHGSLFRALLATRRTRRKGDAVGAPAGRLTSFSGGMTDLVDALWTKLGDAVRTNTPILAVTGGPPYTVTTPNGALEADAVVLAGPAAESARLFDRLDTGLAGLLAEIPSAPIAVVSLGFDGGASPLLGRLAGFGFLVPRDENIRILGTLWETSIYPNRAPAGKVLFRVMIGGARDRTAVLLDDDALVSAVRHDLAETMGLACAPEFTHVVRHARGIPQYVMGHPERLTRIEARLERHPGLYLAGNSYRSPSVNACIAEADRIAAAVTDRVSSAPTAPRPS